MPFYIDYSVNIGSLGAIVAILAVGWRVIRSLNIIEFRVDLMWQDYQGRVDGKLRTRRSDR